MSQYFTPSTVKLLFDMLNDLEEKKNLVSEEFAVPVVQEMTNALLGALQ